MALDSRYVTAPSLEMYFVDKDTGLPLDGGKVYFYKDTQRSVLKPVYRLSGNPPDYSYVALPNPVILSAVGTFQDNDNNNVVPYYYPYDIEGEIELYFIQVYDKDGVFQFSRQGWPNVTAVDTTENEDITNFIPNGQFLLHNDIPAIAANGHIAGKIYQAITEIAQGGWTFERPGSSTDKDIVTFHRYGSITTNPTGNPRYAFQLESQEVHGDAYKDLRLKFPNVNKFSSNEDIYNLYFEGQSTGIADVPGLKLIIIRYFGEGGSATDEQEIATFTLPTSNTKFNFEISFTPQTMETLGSGDDDYLQLAIRFPNALQSDRMTNFALKRNSLPLVEFPAQTNADQLSASTAGWFPTPDPDGMDLYLPVWLTSAGLNFDHSQIGKILYTTYEAPGIGELEANGDKYKYSEYSSDHIPYKRLGDVLYDLDINIPIFGTGQNFVTAVYPTSEGVTDHFRLVQNTIGVVTAPANGTPSPGFTFASVHVGIASTGYSVVSYMVGSNVFQIRGVYAGNVADAIGAGSSGFTVSKIEGDSIATMPSQTTNDVPDLYQVTTVAASTLNSDYFQFQSRNPADYGQQNWAPWFNVDGAGMEPTVIGYNMIEIDLLGTDTAAQVAQKISESLNAWDVREVMTVAASSIPAGANWNFHTPDATEYTVVYIKDGAGAIPAGDNVIRVDIEAADTATDLSEKTRTAINKYYYAVPDVRGMFIRGWSDSSNVDPNKDARYSFVPLYQGNKIGTFQIDAIRQHFHSLTQTTNMSLGGAAGTISFNGTASAITSLTGGKESRPVNMYLNVMIKY